MRVFSSHTNYIFEGRKLLVVGGAFLVYRKYGVPETHETQYTELLAPIWLLVHEVTYYYDIYKPRDLVVTILENNKGEQ